MTAYLDCKPGRRITRHNPVFGPGRGADSANTPNRLGYGVVCDVVGAIRQCSRSACRQLAVATLTYVYADSTAVLGPLATYAEPHCYDLCEQHAGSLTVPRGWEVLRLAMPTSPQQPGRTTSWPSPMRSAKQRPSRPSRRPRRFSVARIQRWRPRPAPKAPAGDICASCANLPEADLAVGWNLLISQPTARTRPCREHQSWQRSVLNCCPSSAVP
ncbi:hypothetical protein AHiyo4_14000 [Arthrobacter sp. Hiyo4]|nr:hypothetical protein AHiyo4_14000 [Arthrobacter sp. Hiyo4]